MHLQRAVSFCYERFAVPSSVPDLFGRLSDLTSHSLARRAVTELREAVAKLYNETYRQDKASKYTKDNVCIVPGQSSARFAIAESR